MGSPSAPLNELMAGANPSLIIIKLPSSTVDPQELLSASGFRRLTPLRNMDFNKSVVGIFPAPYGSSNSTEGAFKTTPLSSS
jgi:hypothetical protein